MKPNIDRNRFKPFPATMNKHNSKKNQKQDLNQCITSGLIKQIEKEMQTDYRNRQVSEDRKFELLKEAKRSIHQVNIKKKK